MKNEMISFKKMHLKMLSAIFWTFAQISTGLHKVADSADFDRAKRRFQNQAEQTFSPARLINKWNNTYLIILNMNYNRYL